MSRIRRSYAFSVTMNGRKFEEVIIDSHYEEKHPDISDDLILSLVEMLNGEAYEADSRNGDWEFFMVEKLVYLGKTYRLVCCIPSSGLFLGVVNCFRR